MMYLSRHEEKRAIAIRIRTLQEHAVAFPEQKDLFDALVSDMKATLDRIILEEKQAAAMTPHLFEVKGESDATPKKFLVMTNVMGIA